MSELTSGATGGAPGAFVSAELAMSFRGLAERYGLLVDRGEVDAVSELFTSKGALQVPVSPGGLREPATRRGRKEIRKALRTIDRYVATFHTITGHVLEETGVGDTDALGESGDEQGLGGPTYKGITTCIAHHFQLDGDQLIDRVMGIHYADTYAVEDGRWRFAERALSIEWLARWPVEAALTRSGTWLFGGQFDEADVSP